ncbi:MAG: biotin--[acetyl-CoA-carboxylase] ligase [Clostridia bacterium]|nr:biotin--[acetyl-CoA-carboxylase] ligase [Clostridia bacterium]
MKYKILNILKENDNYLSGEEIGNILGISRAAVWKNITRLKEMGYEIDSVSNKGYKLFDNADVLNENEINYDNLIYKAELDSTNEECKRQANAGCCSGLFVVCDQQTAGKGRLGRSWVAEKSSGLYMSMLLKPDIMPVEAPQMTLVAGIAIRRIINRLTGLNVEIKWPNDIIINGKKLVGILTEMSAEMEKVNYIVVGIGINVNMAGFEGELKEKAASLYIETGRKFKRSDIINEFLSEFKLCYDEFCKNGFESFVNEYNEYCANVNKAVKTVGGKEEISGIAKGVNSRGELLILSNDELVPVFAGEVSLRLSDDRYI